ncbi:MAG TPA: DinB family protein, partial [Anaerolineae bacterium]|nr:DinB family protein [Anaerolineae bacterium]
EGLNFEFEEVDSTTFPTDFDPLHPNELEALLRWMAVSRQELVDLVRDLPEEALTWKPDDDNRSIRDILFHLAEADVWYTDRLKQWPEAPLFRLAAARSVALERLRAASNTDAGIVTTHDGEEWTPRKIVRRMLEHEREHIQQIRAMLAEMAAKK